MYLRTLLVSHASRSYQCASHPHARRAAHCSDREDEGTSSLGPIPALSGLKHLSLQWPLRSAIPPADDVPREFSCLTALTTLKLRRVPLQDPSPQWLTVLTALEHLYWDPFLPVDLAGKQPSSLAAITQLKTLYIEMLPPLRVPASLTALEKLVIVGRGAPPMSRQGSDGSFTSCEGGDDKMEWLGGMSNLVSLRLQGAGLRELPEAMQRLTGLTRLGLMCNGLTSEALQPGPWVSRLQHLHLGTNCISSSPPAFFVARQLRTLHLANQRPVAEVLQGPSYVTQRLMMTEADVAALLAMPLLEIVVMGVHQPQVQLASGARRNFDWLQATMKNRKREAGGPIKLTSNELYYTLEPLDVFNAYCNGASPLLG